MENLWNAPNDERIVTAHPFRGNFIIFTEKSVYSLISPPQPKWYRRVWNWFTDWRHA